MRRSTYLPLLAGLALLLCAATASALEPFTHSYKSTFAGFTAKATRSLTQMEDGTWQFKMAARNLLGRYEEVSHFRLNEAGYPVPIKHRFKARYLRLTRRTETTHFDWQAGTATWQRKKTTRTAELKPGTLDRLLYQLLIPRDLATSESSTFTYHFINRGRPKTYEFEISGAELIDWGGQDVKTVLLRRTSEDESRQTTLWLAPEMGYEMLRIHHRDESGADYDMVLRTP